MAVTDLTPKGPLRMIDLESPVPYYYQLYEILRGAIEEGYWPPGSQLMTEAELCEYYGVSRATVRQTLAQLLSEGLIRKERGRGTFVAEPKIRERLAERLTGFYDDMVAQGLKPQTRVLRSGVVPASQSVGTLLGIPAGTPVCWPGNTACARPGDGASSKPWPPPHGMRNSSTSLTAHR